MENLLWILLALFLWWVGGYILWKTLPLTKADYQQRSVLDYSTYAPSIGDFSIIGIVIDLIVALVIGLFFKWFPWWVSKTFSILIAAAFLYLGYRSILQIWI
jgi:hypothetical protein